MPKAILEFNLPEEQEEFNVSLDAARLDGIIRDLDNYLRDRLKYDDLSEEQFHTYERIRNKLLELME